MNFKPTATRPKEGIGVDSTGSPSVDPSENVKALIGRIHPSVRRVAEMNFISREQAIALVKHFEWSRGQDELLKLVESLFSFPAPNPDMKNGRNYMGQTEDEFWEAVERQEK